MVRFAAGTVGLLALGALTLGPAWSQLAEKGPEGLIGVWLRDEASSDDVEQQLEEIIASSRQGVRWTGSTPFGQRGQGSQGQRGRGRGRGPDREQEAQKPRERLLRFARGLQVLQFDALGEQLSLRNANRETRVLFPDGRLSGGGLGSRLRTSWNGQQLVVETQTESQTIVETFEVLGDGSQMVLVTDVQGGRGVTADLQFRSVYELVEGTGGAQPARVTALPLQDPSSSRNPQADSAAPSARGGSLAEPSPEPQSSEVQSSGAQSSRSPSSPSKAPRPQLPVISRARVSGGGASGASAVDVAGSDQLSLAQRSRPILILPLQRVGNQLLTGKTLVQTLAVDSSVATVDFYLDDERVARKTLPPYEAKVPLDAPGREQTVRVEAYSANGRLLGEDERLLNRIDPPFRVRLADFDGDPASGGVTTVTEISVPRQAKLESASFYYGDELVDEIIDPRSLVLRVRVPTPDVNPQSYIRVVGRLDDGRELEDVQLLLGADFSEEVDVHLVQLQVLVTDKRGTPLQGLEASDFEVRHAGQSRSLQRLYPSQDVPLVLGLAIDSSGSMAPIWPATRRASQSFLDSTLTRRDQAFLVDFDTQLRLLQPVTGDRRQLFSALGRLHPQGNTALYDSVLFSMLQYDERPGRRALIVLTDGFDSASKSDPKRAIEFGKRLGVPVYVIAMTSRAGPRTFGGPAALQEGVMKGQMRLITDPTGGRLFQALNAEQVERAFAQIQAELRQQYVLTFYTDRPPEPGDDLQVRVNRKGAKVKTALPLDLAE
ncbi:MAG: VWA domain-containing protein [Acidobacteriota bacterium]